MPPHTLESTIAQSNYYIDIIKNNFKQVQEAYFGTKDLAKEDQSVTKIKWGYEINIEGFE